MVAKMRSIMLGLVMVAMATPAFAGGIHILSAQYGSPQTGQLCDAAGPIVALCEGHRQCSFDVRNTKLCGDPAFLVVKQLAVNYTCGVGHYTTSVSEYDTSVLACR